ncbi:MAG: M28 family peptidase [Pedobacter sp.]|nr:MAG: M28 family peptidase [Pedobacter sp.]
MKKLFFIPFALLLGCSSLKNDSKLSPGDQLIKDIEILSSDAYMGRQTGTEGAEKARTYLISRLKAIGIKPYPGQANYESHFEFKPRNGTNAIKGINLIAAIPGKRAEAIVISAHYDHVGTRNNEIFNGADDNASGVSGLLQMAKYFAKKKPEHTLIFALFDAEEMGLQGAKAFVNNPPLNIENIKLNINMDMISRNDKNELYAAGSFLYPALKPYLISTNPNLKLMLGHDDPKLGRDDWTNQSDQGAFHAKGIPFIYFGVEDHKDYHKPTDEFQFIHQTFFKDAVNTIQQIVENIDKSKNLQTMFREKLISTKQ